MLHVFISAGIFIKKIEYIYNCIKVSSFIKYNFFYFVFTLSLCLSFYFPFLSLPPLPQQSMKSMAPIREDSEERTSDCSRSMEGDNGLADQELSEDGCQDNTTNKPDEGSGAGDVQKAAEETWSTQSNPSKLRQRCNYQKQRHEAIALNQSKVL